MPKLNRDQQKNVRDYLQNLSTIYGVHILGVCCGWCGLWLGVKNGQGKHGISHGICPACAEKMKGEGKL